MISAAAAGGVYFTAVFAAGFFAGGIRVFMVAPQIGQLGAITLELPVMLAVSWLVCGWATSHFGVPARLSARAFMGAVAFTILVISETFISLFVFRRSFAQHFGTYRSLDGPIGLVGQIAFAAFPMVRLVVESSD